MHLVPKDDSFLGQNLLPAEPEVFELRPQKLLELGPVVFGGQAIVENPHAFVVPKPHDLERFTVLLRRRGADSLAHLPNIPQIEGLVRLAGGGEQFPPDPLLHPQYIIDDLRAHTLHVLAETPQEEVNEGVKYLLRGFAVQLGLGEHILVAHEPVCDKRSAAAWRPHCRELG